MEQKDALRLAAERAAEAIAAARMTREFDFSGVDLRAYNTKDPEMVLRFGSSAGTFNVLATQLLAHISNDRHLGPHAPHLGLSEVLDNPNELIAIPTGGTAANTVPLTWPKSGNEASANLRKLLAVRPFNVARGKMAHIPVSAEEVDGMGWCLILHLNRTYLTSVTEHRSTKATAAAAQSE